MVRVIVSKAFLFLCFPCGFVRIDILPYTLDVRWICNSCLHSMLQKIMFEKIPGNSTEGGALLQLLYNHCRCTCTSV